tara:strand:+ start:572 stop:1429 length:858 start_codon:yes stop_codon:yes gene_type:complete
MKNKKHNFLRQKLLNKYRFVILNEDSYEEKLSYKLTGLNIFLLMSFLAVLIIGVTTSLIAFTSLKEYIPGYDSTELRTKAVKNIETLDSLTQVIYSNQGFINSIGGVITGETLKEEIIIEKIDVEKVFNNKNLKTNKEDSILRKIVEKEDKFNALDSAVKKVDFVLFSPVVGKVTSGFDFGTKHFGIDVALPLKTPVKAVAGGTVVFAEWTVQTGFVIILKHTFGLTSIYKHNDSGIIKQGDLIEPGQVIAFSGNTGELTSGPHLHFELWREGNPINPLDYINFE